MSGIKESFYETKKKIEQSVEKTGELLQLKSKIKENESELKILYKRIGEQYFEQHSATPILEVQGLIDEVIVYKKEEKKLLEQKNERSGLIVCEYCGVTNKKDGQYCTNCGKPLKSEKDVCESDDEIKTDDKIPESESGDMNEQIYWDLVRDIRKDRDSVIGKTVSEQEITSTTANAQVKRGNMALEDADWINADRYFERALNLDPECAEAYLGKWMVNKRQRNWAELIKVLEKQNENKTTERLEACPEDTAYIKDAVNTYVISGYLDEKSITKLYEYDRGYESELPCRKKQKEKQLRELAAERFLVRAQQYAEDAVKEQIDEGIENLIATLNQRIVRAQENDNESIVRVTKGYQLHMAQADQKARELNEDAQKRREECYQSMLEKIWEAEDIFSYSKIRDTLKVMGDYKDSSKLADKCQKEIQRLEKEKQEEEKRQEFIRQKEMERKEKKKRIVFGTVMVVSVVSVATIFFLIEIVLPEREYNKAVALKEAGKYEEAIAIFEELNWKKDVSEEIKSCEEGIINRTYDEAVALKEAGQYEAAISIFEELGDYKDSKQKIKEIKSIYWKNTPIGGEIIFGTYEQDDDYENGKEEIEWIVLEQKKDSILVISKKALDCEEYYWDGDDITWEECDLRTWLNESFLCDAFDEEEQEQILTSTVTADKNPEYDTDAGNDTQDQVFVLSIKEAEEYFENDEARICTATDYAEEEGVYTNEMDSCYWWLRSPGVYNDCAACINEDGIIGYGGYEVDDWETGVRPALWLNLEL